MKNMTSKKCAQRLLFIGIIGCLLYVIGDFLFAATGKEQTTESIGFMVRIAYLDMATWRMVASILCGFVGTLMYYMGFHRMYRKWCNWKLIRDDMVLDNRYLKEILTEGKYPERMPEIDAMA